MSKTAKTVVTILFILVVISLALNGYLVWRLWQFEQQARRVAAEVGPMAQQALSQTADDLASFQNAKIKTTVQIKDEFPIQATIPFKETIDVPIKLTLPISQQINTTILLDPFKTGAGIPVDVNVPINLEIPIDTSVPVVIDRTIPISTTVPLNLDVPVVVAVGDTELAGYIQRLRDNLSAFSQSFNAIMGQ
jgi:hypothetical protein